MELEFFVAEGVVVEGTCIEASPRVGDDRVRLHEEDVRALQLADGGQGIGIVGSEVDLAHRGEEGAHGHPRRREAACKRGVAGGHR